ncbi:MAG: hypothetical protein KatS3mg035_0167 [Bacteroidia bacterium]|nr:MAG: hypothetical protein KatS3mg035_0167 [Bacteroidia bacterium]
MYNIPTLKKSLLFTLLWSIAIWGYAQRSKVTSGAMAVQDQDYEKAIQYLQEAIAKPELLEQKDLAKAHAKLGQAYMGILASGKKELIMKYPNIMNDAYNAFENAKKYDTDKKFANDIKMGFAVLGPLFYQTAFELYKQKMYKPALDLTEKAVKIFEENKNPNIYGVYLLEGYCHVGNNDSQKAMIALDKAIKAHNANPPKDADPAIPSAYSLLGKLYAEANDYDNMNRVFSEGKSKYPDNEEIRKNEIVIYATNPALYEKALAKFEQDIQKNPNDELLKMAYAQLLESKDMLKAIKIYESILEKNPNNKDVLFNLGALYNNSGKEKYDKANRSSDNNEYKKLLEESKADFKKALVYIEKSFQLSSSASNDEKKTMLKALVQICTLLEENEKLKTYKAALDSLN